MPTAPTHAVAAFALGVAFQRPGVPRRLWVTGAALSMVPDLDVIGFRFGVEYGALWGHRGLTHSLTFAAFLAGATCLIWFRRGAGSLSPAAAWSYLATALASHGLLDALTDGGLGIAFLSPWDPARYFFPWRPIAVAPKGLAGLFRPQILPVIGTELLWVWGPAAALAATISWRRGRMGAASATGEPR